MIIKHRAFIIPETENEDDFLKTDSSLERRFITVKGKSIVYYTQKQQDKELLYDTILKLNARFSIMTLCIKQKEEITDSISNIRQLKPEIVIDIRNRTDKTYFKTFNKDLDMYGIKVMELPLLENKTTRITTLTEVIRALVSYRRILFVGTKSKVLKAIKKQVLDEIKINFITADNYK